jgi:hypothetical protein
MIDVSGTGLSIVIKASNTYPSGITCSAFSDDTDPLDFPELTITEYGMGLNGDLITWSSPQPLQFSLSVVPGTPEDEALEFLFEANRVAKNKRSAKDIITITAIYPNGQHKTLRNGRIISGLPGKGVASGGRIKTSTYGFVFENKV